MSVVKFDFNTVQQNFCPVSLLESTYAAVASPILRLVIISLPAEISQGLIFGTLSALRFCLIGPRRQ